LNAYQSPLKKRFHYWLGLHLVMSMIFWGLSFLSNDTNLIISIAVLGLFICMHEKLAVYCNKVDNLVALLFLYTVFVACTYDSTTVIITILLILSLFKLMCTIVLLNTNSQLYIIAMYMFIIRNCSSIRLPFQRYKEFKNSAVIHQAQVPQITQTND